jgi:hypothetical protein
VEDQSRKRLISAIHTSQTLSSAYDMEEEVLDDADKQIDMLLESDIIVATNDRIKELLDPDYLC